MKKVVGVVEEVYIPSQKDASIKIGFKVKTEDNKIIRIEEEQNESNIYILKNDNVILREHVVHGKKQIFIEKIGDDGNV